MPQISDILTALSSAYTGGSDRVTWVDELKPILDNLTNELLARGIKVVANTAALSAESGVNLKQCIVTAVGIFAWQATGTVNGVTVFSAAGGGVWSLVFSSAGGGGSSYEKEIITVTAASTYTIEWTSDRLAAYGQWPNILVWIENSPGVWRQAFIEFEADDPVSPTEFTANFGGSVNAKIIIG